MEDHRHFALVEVLGRKPGQVVGITSVVDAARFMLEEWPNEDHAKARLARAILLKCLEGNCSAAVARVAFIEAAREAQIYVQPAPPSLVAGRPSLKWGRRRAKGR